MSDAIYTGSAYHAGGDWLVRRDGQELSAQRSQAVWNHSPDGFAWGYGGSGPAQLALALLLEEGMPPDDAVRLHQRFKWDVIAQLPIDGDWRVTGEEIRAWMLAHHEAAP